MSHAQGDGHTCLEESATSHPDNPIPEEPPASTAESEHSKHTHHPIASSIPPLLVPDDTSGSDSDSPGTPLTNNNTATTSNTSAEGSSTNELNGDGRPRRASTITASQWGREIPSLLEGDSEGTRVIEKVCCGGGCCSGTSFIESPVVGPLTPIIEPDNEAFRSLNLRLGNLGQETPLTKITGLPTQTIELVPIPRDRNFQPQQSSRPQEPPSFVTPHAPYEVFPARVHHVRELTKPGAEKKTYHFDLDVTDYPVESGNIDFVVGGAIGVQAPNEDILVEDILTALGVPTYARDSPVLLKTAGGRWPTIWGDEMPRELQTTRRELLKWCSDVQSYPPTKPLLRLLAEYASLRDERTILLFLCSAQGQAAFCDLRIGPYITIAQILKAFPSSQPPLPHLLSVLQTLMPRFYSLSQDPSCAPDDRDKGRLRLIEIAVTVHDLPHWQGGHRTGLASGFFQRIAHQIRDAEAEGKSAPDLDVRVPMFRGLMANPLAKEFVSDGPMLLVGAGVGIAPFRGFVQRRLKSANCANKVWVIQGIRDSLLDELYGGEWGVDDQKVRRVVQSRKGESRYVQEEVRHQADLVWFIINALNGRIYVCGSSKGMGEGVHRALLDVAMDKGKLRAEEAQEFWKRKSDDGQYIVETW